MGFIFGVRIGKGLWYLVRNEWPGCNVLAPVRFLGNASKLRLLASVDVLLLILLSIWSYAYARLLKCSARCSHFSFHIVHIVHEFIHSRGLMVALPYLASFWVQYDYLYPAVQALA
jgi:hypothetical protein